jgi:hypothetical protein
MSIRKLHYTHHPSHLIPSANPDYHFHFLIAPFFFFSFLLPCFWLGSLFQVGNVASR